MFETSHQACTVVKLVILRFVDSLIRLHFQDALGVMTLTPACLFSNLRQCTLSASQVCGVSFDLLVSGFLLHQAECSAQKA